MTSFNDYLNKWGNNYTTCVTVHDVTDNQKGASCAVRSRQGRI